MWNDLKDDTDLRPLGKGVRIMGSEIQNFPEMQNKD
jgi:hypothetical protein